ncbi:ABC transporter ATP-binding protein [Elusimicrobiota bacterium]
MLEVKNLTCGYGNKIVLKNISFKTNRSAILGVIGPNGSGKTTLLRGITRAIKLNDGEVFLESENIKNMDHREFARKTAVVSQSTAAVQMTVEEFVLLGRIPHFKNFQFLETARDREIVHKYMKLTDICGFKDRSISELSGGEKQLAVITRALCQEPGLLLMDEPIAHLDVAHQVTVLDLINRLNKELMLTVIIVLHDLNMASEYCHELLLLDKGKIFKKGQPWEVLTYQNIEKVYDTTVVVEKHPFSSKPHVLIVSEEAKKMNFKKRSE